MARIAPPARRLAKEHGIDLDTIEGTGKNGAITTEDITARVRQLEAVGPSEIASGDGPTAGDEEGSAVPDSDPAVDAEDGEEEESELIAKAQAAAEKFRDIVSNSSSPVDTVSSAPVSQEALVTSGPTEPNDGAVVFRSRLPEAAAFDFRIGPNVVRGVRSQDGYVTWRVPQELADGARKHHFITIQRIIEVSKD